MARYANCTGRIAALVLLGLCLTACEGDDGQDGAAGPAGPVGPSGPPGPPPPTGAILIGDGSALTADEIATLGKLKATITDVTVASEPEVEFTVTDANGDPALGIAEGVVWFTFAKLMPADPDVNGGLPYWQSYVNAVETDNPATGDHVLAQAVEATTDDTGSLEELGGGDYRYTFATDVTNVTAPVAVAWEPNLTHRVGLEIRLDGPGEVPLAPDNPIYDFVPDGGAGSGVTKLIADTMNCEGCHYEFAEHGGPRKTVEYCVTCHNPASVDQDTGESIDMAYMAHSIHMGEDRAVPYVVWGFTELFASESNPTSGRFDASEVTYPQSQTYCETCHTASMTHPDGGNWNAGATAKTCGGCHAGGLVAENFDAVTGVAEYSFDHGAAGADFDPGVLPDGSCADCHLGLIATAGPPLAIHSNIRDDQRAREAAGENFMLEIVGATDFGPGQTPTVTIRVANAAGTPYDILTAPEFDLANDASLNLYVQWSTADYYGGDENGLVLGSRISDDGVTTEAIQDLNFRDTGYPLRMRLGAIQAVAQPGAVAGTWDIPYYQALPADFAGDVVFGLAGHPAYQTTDADGVTEYERAAARSVLFFPGATERVAALDSNKCDACHKQIQEHGANRNGNAEFCLLCHNADAAVCQSPAPDPITGACPDGQTNEGFHMGYMIHSIHAASATFKKDDGGSFAGVKFPQSIANCDSCHVAGSYNVARPTARAVSTNQGPDIRVWTDDIATTPTAAACRVCHSSAAAIGHFESQAGQVDALKCTIVGASCGAPDGSSGSGLPNGQESCALCHGTGAEFETTKYHNPGIAE